MRKKLFKSEEEEEEIKEAVVEEDEPTPKPKKANVQYLPIEKNDYIIHLQEEIIKKIDKLSVLIQGAVDG